jgi:uncharacterized protein (DUF2147 family)
MIEAGWRHMANGAWGAVLVACILVTAQPVLAFEPVGLWLTELKAEIRIVPCTEGLCGIVAKPVKPGLHDINNPDPALRGRPIEGLPLIWLTEGRSPQVWDAQLYNPIDGRTYSGVVQMRDQSTLYLRGCVLFIFCKSEEWARLE